MRTVYITSDPGLSVSLLSMQGILIVLSVSTLVVLQVSVEHLHRAG